MNDSQWLAHVNAKFNEYQRGWSNAYADWQRASDAQDAEAMVAAFERQGMYLRAEQLAHGDMGAPPWQQNYERDYLAEAQTYISSSFHQHLRVNAVGQIIEMTPR